MIFAICLVPAEEKLNKQMKGMRREKEEENRMLTLKETGNASITLWPAK